MFVRENSLFVAIVRFNLFCCFSKVFSRERSKQSPPNFAPPFCALCLIVCDFLPKTWNLGRKEGKSAPPQARHPFRENAKSGSPQAARLCSIINNSSAATTTTAASGGNREELLGQRPARRECRPRHEADAGCRNPFPRAARP